MGKKLAQRFHAAERADSRFGIHYNRHVRREIIKQIQSQKATFIDKQSLRLSRWLVKVEDQDVVVVYDKNRKEVVTFLKPEWIGNPRFNPE